MKESKGKKKISKVMKVIDKDSFTSDNVGKKVTNEKKNDRKKMS